MREIALFVEDEGHQAVIGALVQRLAGEYNILVHLDWRSAVRGHGRVVQEFHNYLRDMRGQGDPFPDLIIVATDANCKGWKERVKELDNQSAPAPMIFAVPSPHIERWLLLDSAAFKAVFGKGCDTPDQKCERDLYKQRLIKAIRDAGIMPSLSGIQYARDIVQHMDIDRAKRTDRSRSFRRFVDNLLHKFRCWKLEKQSNSTQ